MSKVNTIKEIAKKIADNNDTNDYDHIPIGADSDNIDRPNGETVEETLLKMESKNIKPLKFTGASTATYDGTTEKTINIPSYTVFKGASASAAGNTGLVPAPVASTSRKYLRDDGTWGVPDTTSYTVMTGATISAAGKSGLVPVPSAGDVTRYLRADATWGTLGAAAFKGIVNNATTTEEGFVPDARVVKGLQDQVNTLNSALESPLFAYLGRIQILENTDTSTMTFTIPEGYSSVFLQFFAPNTESAFGFLDFKSNDGCNLEIKKGTEVAAFRLNKSTRVVTVLIQNKTAYQKKYGNFVNFWGVK